MLKIVSVPNQVLSSPTRAVHVIDNKIKKFVREMEETLVAHVDPMGVGLAANQVGESLSLFIIKISKKAPTKVFINPKILESNVQTHKSAAKSKSKNKKGLKLEGCLSIPRIWGPVKRSDRIFIEYQDLSGKKIREWFAGFEATVIQHEMDHLGGIVFTQRCLEQKKPLYREEKGELRKIESI